MKGVVILLFMVFMHIVADYNIQGWLATAKCKEWWINQPNYSDKYKNDYKVALFMHSFEWTFMIMLPLLVVFGCSEKWLMVFIFNIIIHYIVDDCKANDHLINLVDDQIIHLCQIGLSLISILLDNPIYCML